MKVLTSKPDRRHIRHIAKKKLANGLGNPSIAVARRNAFGLRLFGLQSPPQWAAGAWAAERLAGCDCFPVYQPESQPPTMLGNMAGGSTEPKKAVMNRIAKGASAPMFPVAFTAEESSTIRRAMLLIERHRLRNRPILKVFKNFERYLVLRFAGLTNEQGHVLYLRADGGLLKACAEAYGNAHSVKWDLRTIVMRAITLGACQVILAHNHPNEDPVPSDADVAQLDSAGRTLAGMQIALVDSYVVTSKGVTSIRGHKALMDARAKRREN